MLVKIYKFSRILLGIAAGPGLFLILPFLITPSDYGRLFGVIAVIQLLSLFSSIGLEIVSARENLPLSTTCMTLIATTLLATVVYGQIKSEYSSFGTLALIFSVVLANNIALVIQNQFLFWGNVSKYAMFGICRAFSLIAILMAFISSGFDILTCWAVASVSSALFTYVILRVACKPQTKNEDKSNVPVALFSVYLAALPMAVLNSMSSLPFLLERLIAKGAFSPDLFSKYALCATLVSPLVYLGNMVQNYLISNNGKISSTQAFSGGKLLMVLFLVYIAFLFVFAPVVYHAYFYDRLEFVEIALPSILWVFFYCVVAFPLAAIMQKQADAKVLFKCALFSVVAVGVLTGCYEVIFQLNIRLDLPWKAASAVALFASAILTIRAVFIWPLTNPGITR